jgi:hypothetical protein
MYPHWYLLNAEFPGDGDTGVVDGGDAVSRADGIHRITSPSPLAHALPKYVRPASTASRVLAEPDVCRVVVLDN